MLDDAPFSVHVVGERTKKTWAGDFRAVSFLSHRKMLQRDRLVREFLGPNAETSEERARAVALADCQVSLTKAASWWSEYGNGLDLIDENVLLEVWRGIQAVQKAALGDVELTADEKKLLKDDSIKAVKESVPE